MEIESAIRAKSLSKTYRSGATELVVFQDLSLVVSRGERLAIMGQSGAGKSTLLHLLGGLDRPSGGEVIFDSRDIVSLGEQELASFRNREIGFVWQNPSLLAEFTALENVMMPLLIRGRGARGGGAGGRRAVGGSRAGGARLASRGRIIWRRTTASRPGAGARYRAARCCWRTSRPGISISRPARRSLDCLNELHAAHGLTSVVVTHNLSFASRCDRVLELKKGGLYPVSKLELQEAGVVQDATRLDGGTYV